MDVSERDRVLPLRLATSTFLIEEQAAAYLAGGALARVLEDWCELFAGYFLYYPRRRQQPAALSALIEALLDGARRT